MPEPAAALRGRIAAAIRDAACSGNCGKTGEECAKERIQPFVWHHGRLAVVEGAPEMFADAVLAVLPPPTDRAAVLRSAADRIDATRDPFPIAVQNGITWATAELRRLAAEAQPVCAECGHPHAAHREGDDPVTPGTCSACSDSDCDHDYTAAAGAQPTAEHHTVGGIRYLCHADDHYCPHQAAAGAQPTTKPETDEDPARIDRLRPEFTEHASIESIDAQLRRSRAQQRRWHVRTEWLISLRDDRVAQKARGEWPAAGARQDGAQQ